MKITVYVDEVSYRQLQCAITIPIKHVLVRGMSTIMFNYAAKLDLQLSRERHEKAVKKPLYLLREQYLLHVIGYNCA